MARLPRLVIPNQPLHIMHRGNNHQGIFDKKHQDKVEEITKVTEREDVYGESAYHNYIADLTDRPTRLSRHGGDRKSKKFNNQISCFFEM